MLAVAKSPFKGFGRSSADTGMIGMINAINRVQAVIEFTMDGKILTRERKFLEDARLFAGGDQGQSSLDVRRSQPTGRALNIACSGKSSAAANMMPASTSASARVARRFGSRRATTDHGSQRQAFKVVKYATDITEQKLRMPTSRARFAAISKAQAVIEFALDGKVLTANENFLDARLHARRNPRPASQHVRRAGLPAEPGLPDVLGEARTRRIRCRSIQAHRQGRQGSHGFRPATIRSWMRTASRSKSSNMPPTSPLRCMAARFCSWRCRPRKRCRPPRRTTSRQRIPLAGQERRDRRSCAPASTVCSIPW